MNNQDQRKRESNMLRVILLNDIRADHVPSLEKFEYWIHQTLSMITEKKILENFSEICIRIVDQATSEYLNTTYRQKKYPTNVLSFPYEITPGIPSESLGDLAICAEVVAKEAAQQHKKLESHWAHLTVHGVLHLLGYDHIIDNDADIMEALEIRILEKLHIENPYEQHGTSDLA